MGIALLPRKREADPLLTFDHLLVDEQFWRDYEDALRLALAPRLLNVFMAGAYAAAQIKPRRKAQPLPSDLPAALTQEQLQAIAEGAVTSYVTPFLQDVTRTTRDAVGKAVVAARRDGTGVEGVFQSIRPYFDTKRADMIAITETTRLFGRGAQAVYRAQGYGGWEWRSAMDPWVDTGCQSRNGQEYAADVDFEPLHPRCRCWPAPLYDAPAGTSPSSLVAEPQLGTSVSLPPLKESPRLIGSELWDWIDEAAARGYSQAEIRAALSESASDFITDDQIAGRIWRAEQLAKPLPPVGPNINARGLREVELGRSIEWKEWATEHGMSTDEYIEAANARLREILSEADVYVQTPERALARILEQGSYKPVQETGATGAGMVTSKKKLAEYKQIRDTIEEKLFGENQHPIYGYLDTAPTSGMRQYGDTAVKLKSSVRSRTTFTQNDSLDSNSAHFDVRESPSYIESPTIHSVNHDALQFQSFQALKDRSIYVEAQIHDGLTIDDIESVTFFSPPALNLKTTSQLDALGIPWQYVSR